MSVNEKMTVIADAIRTKAGVSGAMGLDQMAATISGISTGMKEFHGTLTITEDGSRSISIPNQLGVVPKLVFFCWLGTADNHVISENRSKYTLGIFMEAAADVDVRSANYGILGVSTSSEFYQEWYTYGSAYNNNSYCVATKDFVQFGSENVNASYAFDAGDQYFYMVIG